MTQDIDCKPLSITIDGPAGAGKSTTARLLAAQLGYAYIDSGAMYRAVALYCKQQGVAVDDAEATASAAGALNIQFVPALEVGGEQTVLADGTDITSAIRTPEISQLASTVSVVPAVREHLVAKQRALGEAGGVVMEGRDIGTVVLPDAPVKVFLTASLEERASRRFKEMQDKGNTAATLDQVQADMAERDRRDTTRAVSPLMAAADAVTIQSDHMNAAQVVETILALCGTLRPKDA